MSGMEEPCMLPVLVGLILGRIAAFFPTSIFSTGSVGANQAKCMSLYFRLSM